MKDFGYTISLDRSIDFDNNDKRLSDILSGHEPSVRVCIGCGSCTATCSSGHFTSFNVRKLHTLVRRGETDQLKKELSKCMFCGKCQLVCPRGVNLRNLILTLNRAVAQVG